MPDPTPWTDVLPQPHGHGYPVTASVEVRMRIAERALLTPARTTDP